MLARVKVTCSSSTNSMKRISVHTQLALLLDWRLCVRSMLPIKAQAIRLQSMLNYKFGWKSLTPCLTIIMMLSRRRSHSVHLQHRGQSMYGTLSLHRVHLQNVSVSWRLESFCRLHRGNDQNLGFSDLAIATGWCSLLKTSFPSLNLKRTVFHWQYHISPRASLDGCTTLIQIYARNRNLAFRMTRIIISLYNSTSLCLHT